MLKAVLWLEASLRRSSKISAAGILRCAQDDVKAGDRRQGCREQGRGGVGGPGSWGAWERGRCKFVHSSPVIGDVRNLVFARMCAIVISRGWNRSGWEFCSRCFQSSRSRCDFSICQPCLSQTRGCDTVASGSKSLYNIDIEWCSVGHNSIRTRSMPCPTG